MLLNQPRPLYHIPGLEHEGHSAHQRHWLHTILILGEIVDNHQDS